MIKEQEVLKKILEYIDELLSMLILVITHESMLKIEAMQNKIRKISNKRIQETKKEIKEDIKNLGVLNETRKN